MAGKPRGRPFQKGQGGRPPGIPNKATRDIQAFSRAVLEDPEYVESLSRRLKRGDAPHMETLLHHYGYGKPKDVLELNQPRPLVVELLERAETPHDPDAD